MTDQEQAIAFYESNYDIIGSWFIQPGDRKTHLGDDKNKRCRFCGKSAPDVTFGKEAHAISVLLGNRSLVSNYECDTCNQFFGSTIEDDFGKWSKPMRTMVRIRGRNGVPTLKRGGDTGWRIELGEAGLEVKSYEDDPVFELDEAAKTIKFKLKREPYKPIAVMKAFVKMGLTLMPEEEIGNFKETLRWVREPNHQRKLIEKSTVMYTFQPGPMPNDLIVAMILRRKPTAMGIPFSFLVLSYGNEVYQVMLPSFAQDAAINGLTQSIYRFPHPGSPHPERFPKAGRATLDLSGIDTVKGEPWPITMGFDAIQGGPVGEPE